MKISARKRISGISLIEVMIGLVILGFGLIGVAKFQTTLMSNSDTARQRNEATRLAQKKMEELRAFEQLTAGSGKFSYADIVTPGASEAPTLSSNTAYSRLATVTDSSNAAYKMLNVVVSWTDRLGSSNNVTLNSVIAKLDPKVSGSLIIPPAGSPVKKPMNRSLNVPVPAVDLEGGTRSAFTPPGATNLYFVFDNDSGIVKAKCTGATSDYSVDSCPDDRNGYLLSGYVSFSTGNTPSASSPSDARMDLTVSMALTQAAPDLPNYECYDDGSTSATYANVVTYTCIVYPLDHDNDSATPRRWSGATSLALAGGTIGTGSSQYKVCRYSFDYDQNGSTTNDEHPATYTDVTAGLQNQNFLVIKGNKSCPSDSTIPTQTVLNYNTVQQQP